MQRMSAFDPTTPEGVPAHPPETSALPYTAVPSPAVPAGRDTVGDNGGDDWPRQATRTIVRTVDTVRDKTTGPAITAAAVLVYGLVALTALTILATVLIVGLVRGLEILLWHKVWLAYLVLAATFLAAGLVSWSRREPLPG
jgi:hypothetical protein